MKTKLAILLTAGLPFWGTVGLAQSNENVAPGTNAKAAPESAEPASAVSSATTGNTTPAGFSGDEVVPSIIFDETPLTEVIETLKRQAGINAVVSQEIAKPGVDDQGNPLPPVTVSFRFENVTSKQALSAVLKYNGLELVPDEDTGIALIKKKDPNALPPLVTEVIQLNYSTTNIATAIKAVMSDKRSTVIIDERTSQMVLVAPKDEIKEAQELVALLDMATRQVLIEARILETSRNPSTIKGIDWAGTLQAQNFGFGNGLTTGTTATTIPGATTTSTTTLPGGATVTSTSQAAKTEATTLSTALGNAGLTANTLTGYAPNLAILNADGVRGVLSFLNQDADTRVVATPRTVTLDNQEAKLSVTRAFPIFSQNPGSAQVAATTEITYTNLGTILTVTPRIAANNTIQLKVTPEVSNIDGQDSQVINGQDNRANIYAIRRIETQVSIPSGNTLVMGGLISDTRVKSFSKVPILGDLPGLGLLFRRDSKEQTKANLIVFITPTVVEDFDFQYTPTDFLRNSIKTGHKASVWEEDAESKMDSPWNSGRPKNWSTPDSNVESNN